MEPSPSAEPHVAWHFVDSLVAGGSGVHLAAGPISGRRPLEFRDCRFAGGKIQPAGLAFAFTNCIFDRVNLEVASSDDEPSRHFHHNFFRSGTVQIELPTSTQVLARNNFFEGTTLGVSGTSTIHAVVIDQRGHVLTVVKGPFTEDGAAKIEAALK